MIQATGGGGAASSSNVATAGTGGTPNGNAGSRSTQSVAVTTNGGTGFEMSFSKTSGTYGRGSGVKGSSNYTNSQASGGSGGYNTKYIDVPALTTLTISIGNYGNSSVYNAYPPPTINNGTSGFVLIAYGEGIE